MKNACKVIKKSSFNLEWIISDEYKNVFPYNSKNRNHRAYFETEFEILRQKLSKFEGYEGKKILLYVRKCWVISGLILSHCRHDIFQASKSYYTMLKNFHRWKTSMTYPGVPCRSVSYPYQDGGGGDEIEDGWLKS